MIAIRPLRATPRPIDARGSYCPGPLMELIRAIRESRGRRRHRRLLVGQRLAGPTSPSGSRRPATGWSASRPATATTRSSSRSCAEARDAADRRSWAAGSAARSPPTCSPASCAARSMTARSTVTVVDADRRARLPAGLHVHRDGRRARRRASQRPERGLLDRRVGLVVGEVDADRRGDADRRARETASASATTSSCWPPARGSCPRRSSTSTPRRTTSTPPRRRSSSARRSTRSPAARIVIGIAGMPYKCPPAPLEVAFLIEAELRERGLREKSEIHFCSPIGRAFTIETCREMATPMLEREGHRAAHVLQRRDDRPGAQGRRRASRARSCPTTC